MIHEILPSDVEFAKGMLDASHSDEEIRTSLAARGIEPAKAAALVDTLRHGQTPHIPFPPGLPVARHHHEASPSASNSPPPEKRHVSREHFHRNKLKASARWLWVVVVAVIFTVAIGYVLLQVVGVVTHMGVQQDIHELPHSPGR
ncbi:MAG TPA: hypothetical protein PKI20_10795 [Verrucomicrobiota bacterium]|nr:hypothetical protein [Verrucomicrobiota bacterium]HQL78735.1 hypothetical protein [Verrucomicrobiota bacterium]